MRLLVSDLAPFSNYRAVVIKLSPSIRAFFSLMYYVLGNLCKYRHKSYIVLQYCLIDYQYLRLLKTTRSSRMFTTIKNHEIFTNVYEY